MQTQAGARGVAQLYPRIRGGRLAWEKIPADGAYRRRVPPRRPKIISDPRKLAWSQFVDRALRQAEDERGWSIPRVAAEVGVGDSTIYRWLDGEWTSSPNGDHVAAFCWGLDIPVSAATSVLWPDKGAPSAVPAAPEDPDVDRFLRKFRDPHTPPAERAQMRELLRYMGSRRPIDDATA